VSSEGASLLSLRDAAKEFKVDAEIRRYQPQDVDSLALPAIGQFNASGTSVTLYHFDTGE
jgi:hypothetical protein